MGREKDELVMDERFNYKRLPKGPLWSELPSNTGGIKISVLVLVSNMQKEHQFNLKCVRAAYWCKKTHRGVTRRVVE